MALRGDGRSRGERSAPGVRASGGRPVDSLVWGSIQRGLYGGGCVNRGGDVRGQSSERQVCDLAREYFGDDAVEGAA
jgi:hypothetical protein